MSFQRLSSTCSLLREFSVRIRSEAETSVEFDGKTDASFYSIKLNIMTWKKFRNRQKWIGCYGYSCCCCFSSFSIYNKINHTNICWNELHKSFANIEFAIFANPLIFIVNFITVFFFSTNCPCLPVRFEFAFLGSARVCVCVCIPLDFIPYPNQIYIHA